MTFPYTLPRLPYPSSALEPNLNRATIMTHHDQIFFLLLLRRFLCAAGQQKQGQGKTNQAFHRLTASFRV